MNNIKNYLSLCLFLFSIQLNAQNMNTTQMQNERNSFGIGAGLDYGGMGVNMLVYPQKNIGLFAGLGYAIAGVGFNAGTKVRFNSNNSSSKLNPYFIAMYGYNCVISVKNASQYNKFYYGPSLGFGMDLHSKRKKNGYWSIAILVPFRNSEVDNYIDDLKNNHGVDFKNELSPITLSVGYRFVIN